MGCLSDLIYIIVIIVIVVLAISIFGYAAASLIGGSAYLFVGLVKGLRLGIDRIKSGNPILFFILFCIGVVIWTFAYISYSQSFTIKSNREFMSNAKDRLEYLEKGGAIHDGGNYTGWTKEEIRDKIIPNLQRQINEEWQDYLPWRIVSYVFIVIGILGSSLTLIYRYRSHHITKMS